MSVVSTQNLVYYNNDEDFYSECEDDVWNVAICGIRLGRVDATVEDTIL